MSNFLTTGNIKTLVRPIVTAVLVVGFVLAALGVGIDSAVEDLKQPTMLVLGFWFIERAVTHLRDS